MEPAVYNLLIQVAFRFTEALFSPLMLIMLAVIGWQYWRLARGVVEEVRWAVWLCLRLLVIAVISGIIIGVLGSIILVVTGVNVAATGLVWLWLVALLLMLANPRYLCFAYAGGLVGVINLLTGWPGMDVSQLMVLIATLHLLEALLICTVGEMSSLQLMVLIATLHLLEALLICTVGEMSSLPTVVRNHRGQVVGGFNLQQFWPLPLVAAINGNPASIIPVFPSWWPLFNSGGELLQLIGVLAVLGYAEITTTDTPKERTRRSACNLLIYSLVLFILALLSINIPSFKWLAVLFAPLGHELVIYLGLKREEQGKPRWAPVKQGVQILWVIPASSAGRAGLRGGDIITSIDGETINNPDGLYQALNQNHRMLALVVWRGDRELVFTIRKAKNRPLGLLLAPGNDTEAVCLVRHETWFHRLLPRPKTAISPK